MSKKVKAAIIGPGNIGTDLLMKAMRSKLIEPVWMVGVEAESPGLKRAKEIGLKTTADGVDGMVPSMKADGVQICFDATSAYVHAENSRKVNEQGAVMIDLTPELKVSSTEPCESLSCEPACKHVPSAESISPSCMRVYSVSDVGSKLTSEVRS